MGIPPEAMNKLFKPFSQVNGSLTREYGGTGLGLAISKRLVELLGGSITAASRINKGTMFRFSVTFTLAAGTAGACAHAPAVDGKKILLAHDNAIARKVLQMMANAYHVPFAIARSGASVQEMLAAAIEEGMPYDALFLGETLPDCASIDLLETLGSQPRLCGLKTVLVGPFTEGAVKTLSEHSQTYTVLTRFSKQSEFYEALCAATGKGPFVETPFEEEAPYAEPAADAETSLRILVVDDNIVNQQVAADLLEAMGYAPDIAGNGEKAVEMASAEAYDIIFMDCQMPVMDGYEATRRIHSNGHASRNGVIIAMTAHAIEGDREACVEAGMDDYIAKPIRFEDLRLMIEKWKKKIFQPQE
jgi:CheY-like chemotaxis protein